MIKESFQFTWVQFQFSFFQKKREQKPAIEQNVEDRAGEEEEQVGEEVEHTVEEEQMPVEGEEEEVEAGEEDEHMEDEMEEQLEEEEEQADGWTSNTELRFDFTSFLFLLDKTKPTKKTKKERKP